MRITVPDDIADQYVDVARRQGRSVEDVLVAQLTRFVAHPPGDRAVVLAPAVLTALSEALFGLPVRDGADLLTRVQALAGLSFQHLRLTLSEQQLYELQDRAVRQGRPVETLVAEMAQIVLRDLFYVSQGGTDVGVTVSSVPRPAAPAKAAAAKAPAVSAKKAS